MPKMKTNRSVAKRVRFTKTGKVKRFKSGKRHLLTGKSAKEKGHMCKSEFIKKVDIKVFRKLVPYGK